MTLPAITTLSAQTELAIELGHLNPNALQEDCDVQQELNLSPLARENPRFHLEISNLFASGECEDLKLIKTKCTTFAQAIAPYNLDAARECLVLAERATDAWLKTLH